MEEFPFKNAGKRQIYPTSYSEIALWGICQQPSVLQAANTLLFIQSRPLKNPFCRQPRTAVACCKAKNAFK
jgi:hypothetical protein